MAKLSIVTGGDFIKVLQKSGYYRDRQVGSHVIMVHKETDKTISVPVHRGRTLGRGITRALLRDAGISREEFLRLL